MIFLVKTITSKMQKKYRHENNFFGSKTKIVQHNLINLIRKTLIFVWSN